MPDDLLDGLSVEERQRWHRGRIDRVQPGEAVLVATQGTSVVGFVSTGRCRDVDHEGALGELYSIYVEPDLIGTGVGRGLMEAAEAQLAAYYDSGCLWVAAENLRARRFYEQAGWSADGSEKSEVFGGRNVTEVRYRKSFANRSASTRSSG